MSLALTPRLASLRIIAADIKLAHSVFALPFALLAAFMAAAPEGAVESWTRFGGQLALIVLAMAFARTVAMLSNRLLDRAIDEQNPRTAGRALPSGRLSTSVAFTVLIACASLFMVVCAFFGVLYGNWWPVSLGLPVLAWISGYPFLKRFTALCHLYLGSSLAISPLAAALAVQPAALAEQPGLWLLGAVVLCWVAGFDIIYALQDIEIDRAQRLFSLPSRRGPQASLWVSRILHVIAAAALVALWLVDDRLAVLFGAAVVVVMLLLLYEHATVSRWGTTRIALAFFTLNGLISCVLGVLGIADVLFQAAEGTG